MIFTKSKGYKNKQKRKFYLYLVSMFFLQAICLNEVREYTKAEVFAKKAIYVCQKLLNIEKLRSFVVKVGSKITKNYVEKTETLRDYEINVLNLNDEGESRDEINRQDFEREQMLEKMKI